MCKNIFAYGSENIYLHQYEKFSEVLLFLPKSLFLLDFSFRISIESLSIKLLSVSELRFLILDENSC